MTRYGFEPDTTAIRASWLTGRGPLGATVVASSGLDDSAGVELADGLEWLSAAVWRCYTHPAGPPASPEEDFDGERFQRGLERDALDTLSGVVRDPRRPDRWGEIPTAPTWVAELAHCLGRSLHRAGAAAELVEAVAAEATREVAAVSAAERGELSGRAEQATGLSHPDPSPVQVAAADGPLSRTPTVWGSRPRGRELLFRSAGGLPSSVSDFLDRAGRPQRADL